MTTCGCGDSSLFTWSAVELFAKAIASATSYDAASINTDYAVKAGLQPTKDAIAIEDLKGPYANLIAVRAQDPGADGVPDGDGQAEAQPQHLEEPPARAHADREGNTLR